MVGWMSKRPYAWNSNFNCGPQATLTFWARAQGRNIDQYYSKTQKQAWKKWLDNFSNQQRNDNWQKSIPNRAGLVQRPINLDGRSTRRWAWDSASRITVMKNSGSGEDWSGETTGNHNVVVLSGLIHRYEDGVRLPNMNIKGGVRSLKGVSSFYFCQCQPVALNAEVEWML